MYIELPDTATAGFRLPCEPLPQEEECSTVTVLPGSPGGRGSLARTGRASGRGAAGTQVCAGDGSATTFTAVRHNA
jgi:hypothetical protein